MTDTVPHDPVGDMPDQTCPLCELAWPCPERMHQRKIIKGLLAYLQSDLYSRVPSRPDDPPGMRWTSPLGWSVFMTYGVTGVPVAILRGLEGNEHASTTNGSVEWLQENLP